MTGAGWRHGHPVAPLLRHGYHQALLLAAVVILPAAAAAGVLPAGFPHVPPAARQPDPGTS